MFRYYPNKMIHHDTRNESATYIYIYIYIILQYAYHIYIQVPRSEYINKAIPCILSTYHMTSRTGISFLFYRLSIDKDTVTDLMLPRPGIRPFWNFLDNKKKIPYFTNEIERE